MLKTKKIYLRGDRFLLLLPLVLSFFGLLMIFNASSVSALRDFQDKFHYFKKQAVWVVLGALVFGFFAKFDYSKLKKFAFPAFLASLFLLVLVLLPGLGKSVYGGRRWLEFGFLGMQPAELTKLTLVIYLATLFEKRRELKPFLTVVGLVLGLVILEPDMGTAGIIVLTAFGMYFLAGAAFKEIGIVLGSAAILGPLLIWLFPYRRQRVLTFFNSSFDAQGASYHVRQVLIALGSGGIFGRGLGQSRQKFLFLPEVTTDSIFAVIAEDFGFIGASFLILAFLFLIYRGIKVASSCRDPFGKLLATGLICGFGLQVVINLGAMVALVPLTGVPLPLISYGGSSLVIILAGLGIVYNISRNNK
ncbi:MAG: putative lipid II flippase FtsW [Patescibacteria group bacterium]|nr:putative lipid II flippase FtsW [Patescibacteria group bacterium]